MTVKALLGVARYETRRTSFRTLWDFSINELGRLGSRRQGRATLSASFDYQHGAIVDGAVGGWRIQMVANCLDQVGG